MKNLNRVFFFGGLLLLMTLLTVPFTTYAQEAAETAKGGLFSGIFTSVKGGILTMILTAVSTLLGHWGVLKIVKYLAKKGQVVLRDVGELCLDGSDFLGAADNMINDDNSINAKNVPEAIALGKHLIMEGKIRGQNVVMELKPTKTPQ